MSDVSATTNITLSAAQRVLAAAVAAAEAGEAPVCVAVCDAAGHPVLSARMDGAALLVPSIAADKAYTVVAFNGMATSEWWPTIEQHPELIAGLVKTDRLMVFAGGIPIVDSAGVMVGAIGVAGATSEQDERFAVAGATAF